MKKDPIDWFLDGPVTDQDVALKWANLKSSANDRGIEFSLSLRRVKQLLQAKSCYYTRISFTPEAKQPTSKTIDRVDNNVGYTDENTVVCCFRINSMKGSMTIAQIEAVYKGVMRHVAKVKAKNKPQLKRSATPKKKPALKVA